MREIVLATTNKGKIREIKELLKDFNLKILSLEDFPGYPQVEEDGKTFAANAIKKAATMALYSRKLTIGEDSGLEVKAIGNQPGVYSARFSGKNATDEKNNRKLLAMLKNVPAKQRQARYHCCVAIVDGRKIIDVIHGTCGGVITHKYRGKNGFGYDPLFLIRRYDKTFGELDPAIKSKISHRARAFRKVKKILSKYFL